MQGQLSELDVRSIFQLIEVGQQTGELYIESYDESWIPQGEQPFSSWLAFFENGRILYAGRTTNQLSRLKDVLYPLKLKIDWSQVTLSALAPLRPPEYGALWWLLERSYLDGHQAQSLLNQLVEETLFELLNLRQGKFTFRFRSSLSPQLTSLPIHPLLQRGVHHLKEWLQLQPHISSFYSCPESLSDNSSISGISEDLVALANGKTSVIQLARRLNIHLFDVAAQIYPLVKRGDIQMICPVKHASPERPRSKAADSVPRIVCIDDTTAIRRSVETILDTHGYEVTSIGNPVNALSLLFRLQPDLVLCDIAMPELEGYDLCAMLRQAPPLQHIPIIMLTGIDGFVERVRANVSGATDYLTKPFGETELITLVEKYVGKGNPARTAPEALLEQEISAALNRLE